MRYLTGLLSAVFLSLTTFVFPQIKNNGNTIGISSGATIKIVDGNFENNNNGKIDNDGNIIIDGGNWYNNATNNVFINPNDTGTVIFHGTATQTIGGTGNTTHFENVKLDNSAVTGLNLETDAGITGQLTMVDGLVTTNQNKLIILNTDSSGITGYSNTRFINGNLRRYIASNTETYPFPVGNGTDTTNYYPADIINHNLTGIQYIDATFGALTHHNDADMNVSEAGMTYNSVATEGVWYLTPDSAINSGTYDLKCYINNFSGLYDNRFAILSRPDSSLTAADWSADPAGIGNPGINPAGGDGRMLSDGYALRQGFSHFTQFGIGQITCQTAHLIDDTTICSGDSIVLYPGSFDAYSWSTGDTDSVITVTSAGQYYVTVQNANAGCGTSYDTVNVAVTIIDYTINSQNISCYGLNDGQITILPTGGTPDYHYQWSPAAADTATATGLSEGNYYVTITDANGCKAYVEKVPITEPDSLYLLAENTINPLCNGGNDGSIDVSYSGGTPPYHYLWNTSATDASISGLPAGNYSLTLTDDNGCTSQNNFVLTEPAAITVTGDTGIDNEYYGYINLQVTNGTSPYSFVWSNGETTQNIEDLYAGDYIVTVTDFNGCSVVDTFTIEIPLIIPTIITPNGDQLNDTWDIINIESYNDVHIEIYNRWGNLVYTYTGTGIGYKDKTIQWDGKWNGKELPFASYVYIVELNDNTETYRGVVTLKK
jgi:gliding motility-associated-like protein